MAVTKLPIWEREVRLSLLAFPTKCDRESLFPSGRPAPSSSVESLASAAVLLVRQSGVGVGRVARIKDWPSDKVVEALGCVEVSSSGVEVLSRSPGLDEALVSVSVCICLLMEAMGIVSSISVTALITIAGSELLNNIVPDLAVTMSPFWGQEVRLSSLSVPTKCKVRAVLAPAAPVAPMKSPVSPFSPPAPVVVVGQVARDISSSISQLVPSSSPSGHASSGVLVVMGTVVAPGLPSLPLFWSRVLAVGILKLVLAKTMLVSSIG